METETSADRRIMLALRVVGPASERERGLLFGGLVEDRPREVDLPLFPELAPTDHRVPLLEIVDEFSTEGSVGASGGSTDEEGDERR